MSPRLVFSELTGRVLVITRYTDNGRYIVARDKRYVHDVTDDFVALRRKRIKVRAGAAREGASPP